MDDTANTLSPPQRPQRWRRALVWAALLLLLLVAQTLLVSLTINYESTRAQDEVEAVANEAAAEIHRDLIAAMQSLQALAWPDSNAQARPQAQSQDRPQTQLQTQQQARQQTQPQTQAQTQAQTAGPPPAWRDGAADLLKRRRDLMRVEWRVTPTQVADAVDTPYPPRLFAQMPRRDLAVEAELACAAAGRSAAPMFSRSYFVPMSGGMGLEIVDLCLPVQHAGQVAGYLVGSFALSRLLDASVTPADARRHEFSFVEGDGTRLARAGAPRGSGVFLAERVVDLPGATLQLRTDSAAGKPSLIPNLATALVLGLSMALFGLVLLLARDVRRRATAERALADALALRNAMEDSLPTGLRARDLQGRVIYANPAFCAMVGFTTDELRNTGAADSAQQRALPAAPRHQPPHSPPHAPHHPPYWPPELAEQYARRQALRLHGAARAPAESREGFETVFMRKNGERFPVMIYEAPLVDGHKRHTGWMSAVLDLSAQRRVEEISRQQQDRLQATARLATVGEMASLLSHELNQPLAAIASYASGSLNILADQDAADPPPGLLQPGLLQQALERIAEQAERAGRVIKSVHDFVRRREQLHETLPAERLFDAVLPLARMQARKSGTRIEIDLPAPVPGDTAGDAADLAHAPRVLRVRCDRTMLEQVLLNLARNGIQAMENHTPAAQRVLTLRARQTQPRWATVSVIDAGPGIPPDVAQRLFTPFFTTKPEGMGLGLSLCRTVIEQHGGVLDFGPAPGGVGTEFRFTLPTPLVLEDADSKAGQAA